MAGKIKSAIELAMEKAERLPRLTKEEMRQRREEEYRPRGRAIAERFFSGDLVETELDAELARYPGEQGEIVRGAFLESMCQSIGLEDAEAATKAFEGIAVLVPDARLAEASKRLSGILRDYQEQRQVEFAATAEEESMILHELGVSGAAIRLNLQQNERWRSKQTELLQRFRPVLEEVKRELRDRLSLPSEG